MGLEAELTCCSFESAFCLILWIFELESVSYRLGVRSRITAHLFPDVCFSRCTFIA
jgi:hypothetical protein